MDLPREPSNDVQLRKITGGNGRVNKNYRERENISETGRPPPRDHHSRGQLMLSRDPRASTSPGSQDSHLKPSSGTHAPTPSCPCSLLWAHGSSDSPSRLQCLLAGGYTASTQ
ncbi:Immunoglobulin-like and fibronectin type III domain-containing protein 1 [Manis javanica]|nr:Immunoglobulin-like and fibronectin type III domain-containing protein 1 [Manis javanica]